MKVCLSKLLVSGVIFASASAMPASAEIVDFEVGFNEYDVVTSITTPGGTTVSFSLSSGQQPIIAQVGAPRVAYANDDVVSGGSPGDFFLTDGAGNINSYIIAFDRPTLNLSLDLYDFSDADNASGQGDIAILTAYSDLGRTTAVGQFFYTVPAIQPPDGNVATLQITDPMSPILSASLTLVFQGNPDVGTGIDNIQFTIAGLPGDTDGDGDIDDADLGTAFANYTGPLNPGTGGKTFADGDTDGDGDVDDADLGTAFAGYTGPLSPTNIPEPSSLALLALGGLLIRRRRARL